ncbi:MAG: AAA family ATPase [Muribaculaceae bacterium]|nr:AAA family ATPase [Muribaculaceae bacterium]
MNKKNTTPGKATKGRKLNLLNAIEKIVTNCTEDGINDKLFTDNTKEIGYVAKTMSLTPIQAVLFSLYVNRSEDQCIYLNEISRDLKCSTITMLKYNCEIDVLVERGLIKRRKRDERKSYRVPAEVLEALQCNECYQPQKLTNVSADELMIAGLSTIFNERTNEEISFDSAISAIEELLENNSHLEMCSKTLKEFKNRETDMILFLYFSHLWANNSDDDIRFYDLENLYDNRLLFARVKRQLCNEEHPLQEKNLIEFNNDNGMVDRESMRLSNYAKETILHELSCSVKNATSDKRLLTNHTTISPKELFYNPREKQEIGELTSLLGAQRFNEICSRLADNGMRKGFACLFYGSPGTGKTETVLQLARLTGRDIYQVNISQIKSCWVGESEKNIKKIFDNYRAMVESCDIAPILLFNEADAIISKRTEDAQRAVDKMENSIQNIILQEMETLEGIMIATTNLTCNLDKAFERRFLYKIKFDKPCTEAKASIWQSMIPEISADDAKALASKYDFSGGQIENIARKRTVDCILNNKTATDLATLTNYCDNELIEDTRRGNRIGF